MGERSHFSFSKGLRGLCLSTSLPKLQKAILCLMEKICMLDRLLSGMSHIIVGYEFNVNTSTLYIKQYVFKQKQT